MTETAPPPSHAISTSCSTHRGPYLPMPPVVCSESDNDTGSHQWAVRFPGATPRFRVPTSAQQCLGRHTSCPPSVGVAPGGDDPCGKARRISKAPTGTVCGCGGRTPEWNLLEAVPTVVGQDRLVKASTAKKVRSEAVAKPHGHGQEVGVPCARALDHGLAAVQSQVRFMAAEPEIAATVLELREASRAYVGV